VSSNYQIKNYNLFCYTGRLARLNLLLSLNFSIWYKNISVGCLYCPTAIDRIQSITTSCIQDYYIPDNQQCTISQTISCNYWGMHRHLNLIKSKSTVIKLSCLSLMELKSLCIGSHSVPGLLNLLSWPISLVARPMQLIFMWITQSSVWIL
jgi:hypothetical protein